MGQVLQLYQLQSLDSEIDQITQQLTEIAAQLGESNVLKEAKRKHQLAEQANRKAQTVMKDLELETKSVADKISNQEKLLYSGRVLNAKEAANLQDEVASLKRWQSNREEHLLEAMVEAEETDEALDEAKAALAAVQAEWTALQAGLTQQQSDLKRKLGELKARRPAIASIILPDDMKTYEALRPRKAGRAVVGLKNGICQGCGTTPANSLVQRARSGTNLIYCDVCGRILYVP